MTRTHHTAHAVNGSYLTPRFESARVYDAMRKGVFTCSSETPLRDVARMMASYHIHSVVVTDLEGDESGPWGVLSALDLVRFASEDAIGRTAGETAATEVITVSSDDSLAHAAQLMTEHDVNHLLVVHAVTGRPIGMLSTLDLAGVLAWGEG